MAEFYKFDDRLDTVDGKTVACFQVLPEHWALRLAIRLGTILVDYEFPVKKLAVEELQNAIKALREGKVDERQLTEYSKAMVQLGTYAFMRNAPRPEAVLVS